jgi:hypothetical protein
LDIINISATLTKETLEQESSLYEGVYGALIGNETLRAVISETAEFMSQFEKAAKTPECQTWLARIWFLLTGEIAVDKLTLLPIESNANSNVKNLLLTVTDEA